MEKEFDKIIQVLVEGKALSASFSGGSAELKKTQRALLRNMEESGLSSAEGRARTGSKEVEALISFAHRNGFGITNAGSKYSAFDPAVDEKQAYRPLTANRLLKNNVFLEVQKLLWERLAKGLKGTWIFPAAGLDEKFFGEKKVLTIGPYRRPAPGHVAKKAEAVSLQDIERAKAGLGGGRENVLILKGLQNILPPEKLSRFIEMVRPGHVVVFGSAANGVIGANAMPGITSNLERLLEKARYVSITREFFSENELKKLETIHSLGLNHFAWQGGHFPATQVMVFERRQE